MIVKNPALTSVIGEVKSGCGYWLLWWERAASRAGVKQQRRPRGGAMRNRGRVEGLTSEELLINIGYEGG